MRSTKFNQEYRDQFADGVKALPRDKYGRISHADADRLGRQIKADKASGLITHSDFFNCGCVIGSAASLQDHIDPRSRA